MRWSFGTPYLISLMVQSGMRSSQGVFSRAHVCEPLCQILGFKCMHFPLLDSFFFSVEWSYCRLVAIFRDIKTVMAWRVIWKLGLAEVRKENQKPACVCLYHVVLFIYVIFGSRGTGKVKKDTFFKIPGGDVTDFQKSPCPRLCPPLGLSCQSCWQNSKDSPVFTLLLIGPWRSRNTRIRHNSAFRKLVVQRTRMMNG